MRFSTAERLVYRIASCLLMDLESWGGTFSTPMVDMN